MKKLISLLLPVILLFTAPPLSAQNLDKLKAEKQKLEQEIKLTQEKISEYRDRHSLSLHEMEVLQKQIRVREELIANISQQIDVISADIAESQEIIDLLENDIEKLKEEYAKMVYDAYIHQNDYDNLYFIFAAESFDEAYKRIRYLKDYSRYRQKQKDLIEKTLISLEDEIATLESQKEEKKSLLSAEEKNRTALNQEKQEINSKATEFKSKEDEAIAKVKEKERQKSQLNSQIEKLIAEAKRIAREKAEAEARRKAEAEGTTSTENLPALTREAEALSASFAGNKGKLPWPVERGTIIRSFGKKEHSVLKNVYTENNGVDISTNRDAEARAVFDGEVIETFYSPVFQWGVLVQHGEYYTIYLNISAPTVKKGEKVVTKQKIGNVHYDRSTSASELHFEIWMGDSKLNPALWLNI